MQIASPTRAHGADSMAAVPVSLRTRIHSAFDALRLRRVFADDRLRIDASSGTGDTGVVVFGSLNGKFAQARGPEMVATASGKGRRPCLFVNDLSRSWFQDGDTSARMIEIVRAHWRDRGVSRIVTTGGSMGGYAALSFAHQVGATAALAFGPQFDISPAGMPDDPRWREAREAIPAFERGTVARGMHPSVSYFVIHGHKGPDILHWSLFPEGPHIHHYLIENEGHPVAKRLKEQGALAPVFEAVVANDVATVDALLAPLGGRRRTPGENARTAPNTWYLDNIGTARETGGAG